MLIPGAMANSCIMSIANDLDYWRSDPEPESYQPCDYLELMQEMGDSIASRTMEVTRPLEMDIGHFMESQESPTSRRWWQLNLTTGDGLALASVFVALILTVGQCSSSNKALNLQSKAARDAAELQDRQVFVGMALGVLRREAKMGDDGKTKEFSTDVQILREWAVQIINDGAEEHLKIPEKAIPSLISGKSSIQYGGYDYIGSNWDNYGSTFGG